MVAHLLIVLLAKVAIRKKILEFPKTKVIGLDRDKDSKKIALEIESKFKNRLIFQK